MNKEIDELIFLYGNFFDEISLHSQDEIKKKLKDLLKDFKKIISKEKY